MKKRLQTLANLTLVVLILATVNGCKKKEDDEVLNPKPALGTATIKGKLTGDINYTVAGNENLAGVTVLVTVYTEDLVVNPDYRYLAYDYGTYESTYQNFPSKTYTAVTDANGEYTITIEVGDRGAYVDVTPQDKAFDVITGGDPATERKVFYFYDYDYYSTDVTIFKGSVEVRDYDYCDDCWW